ncbi:MPP7 [Bugula neritina]|uniref:MPP7 n=1 Tax=Bugula neritina TaxID=10212 RepID=A0A7J7JPN4_BUGNE|nr:MPP7 [Bugula neritina]
MDINNGISREHGVTESTINHKIKNLKRAGHIPVLDHSYDLAGEIYEQFRNRFFLAEEAKELLYILSQPHVRALFDVHDRVANKEYLPVLPDILSQCDDEDRAIKLVRLLKHNEPLGVTIKNRETDGVICVARVFVGGPAERSGLIRNGDEIHEVNGIPVKGRNIEQVVQILNSCDGAISLKLVPALADDEIPNSKVKIKAYFSYDPSTDLLIPCKDAGLSFKAGDILEIVNTDDPIWWQAKLHHDHTNKIGLIPSRSLQTRRATETYNNSAARGFPCSPNFSRKFSPPVSKLTPTTAGGLLSPRFQRKLNKKSKKFSYKADIKDDPEIQCFSSKVLYEEVELYLHRRARKRPIIIVGPPSMGKHDLKQKLIRENPSYASPIPVTSRPKKILETDGKEYNFVSKCEMEKLIQSHRLLEYGEYKGHLYGITLDSICSIISSGRTCVLVCQPQSLSTLRCAAIKPLVAFLKPPSLEKLKQLKVYTGEKSTKKLTLTEMEEMVLGAAHIESTYSELCDETIVSTDFMYSYVSLLNLSKSSSSEAKWIPSAWLD